MYSMRKNNSGDLIVEEFVYLNIKDKVIMEMIYTVKRIEELDFGCEGRPEGMKDMVRVILKADNGEEESRKVEDEWLYANEIDEGSRVEFYKERKLVKVTE